MSKLFNSILLALFLTVSSVNVVAALDFMGANWIWLPRSPHDGTVYRPGNATFRRDYYPMARKVPFSANILIAADSAYTLYVNGNKIGTGVNFMNAQRYCVPLIADCNVFAVEAENYSGVARHAFSPAGVLATIQIRYTDGFIQTIVTDNEWHSVSGAPRPWPTTAPWKNGITLPPPTENPGPSLPSANWIWTNEVNIAGNAPVGGRAFRKTIILEPGQFVDSMVMDITTDNAYTLYINGELVGSGTHFKQAQRYEVNFTPTSEVVIAVYTFNEAGPAALIASAQFVGCECGCGERVMLITDGSWKYSMNTTAGFQYPGLDDSTWAKAIVEGPYGSQPWGEITLPMANTPQNAGIPGAPMAPPASVE